MRDYLIIFEVLFILAILISGVYCVYMLGEDISRKRGKP